MDEFKKIGNQNFGKVSGAASSKIELIKIAQRKEQILLDTIM